MAEQDFFEEQKEWSRRKIIILGKYFKTFARILGSPGQPVYYVDGFAGPGIYDDRGTGSPIVAARIAVDLSQSPKAYDVKCINVEANRRFYDNLCTNLAEFSPDVVVNRFGEFDRHLPEILSLIGNAPTLFFLDPFGLGRLDWQILEPLFTRLAKTEVLINFNTRQARRLAGFLNSNYAHAESWVGKLTSVMGTEKWIRDWTDAKRKDTDERAETLACIYREQLLGPGRFSWACSYPIRSIPDEALKYHLIYGTRHPLGIDIMNEILCGVEEEFQAQLFDVRRQRPIQLHMFEPPLMTPEEAEQANVEELTSDILEIGLQRGQLTFLHLKMQLFGKWFGRVRSKHYRKACKTLRDANLLKTDSARIDNKTILVFEHPQRV
jgi:three-Cys-motif partner protein